jgi:DNA-binding MarR family transcriptional regulator
MTRTAQSLVDSGGNARKVARGPSTQAALQDKTSPGATRNGGALRRRAAVTKTDRADQIIAGWRLEMPEIAGIALEVTKRTARLNAIFDEVLGAQLAKLGLTRAEYAVLATLRRSGRPYRMRPSDLTAALLLSSGGMSNVLKRIVEAGFVRRNSDPSDGRSSRVELTAEGVRLAETAVRRAVAAHGELLKKMPPAKTRELSDLLREVLILLGDEAQSDNLSL